MKNMNQIMKQAKKMQEDLLKAQQALSERTVEGNAGDGQVRVVVSGDRKIQSVKIDKSLVDLGDVEVLQDLVQLAVQDALTRVEELANSELGKYTHGLNIPGLF